MASKTDTNLTQDASLLDAARQGNVGAIASLLQQALAADGLTVHLHTSEDQLGILLEGASRINQDWIISFVQQGISQIAPPLFQTARVFWKPADSEVEGWQQEVRILPPPQADLLPSSIVQEHVMQSLSAAARSPHLTIGEYDSRFTPDGLLITHSPAPSSPWQRRRKLNPRYACPAVNRLLNRQTEVKAAIATLQAGGAMEFYGEAGSGKSALLCALGHYPQLVTRFPGGIVYQRTYDRPLEDIFQGLFDALYQQRDTAETPEQSSPRHQVGDRKPTQAEIKQILAQHHLCAVLDEMQLPGTALADLVSLPGISILASTSGKVSLPKSRSIFLKGLPLSDAVVLFEEGLRRSLHTTEEQAVEQLCRRLAGHPRRILQCAALIRHRRTTLPELVQQLQKGASPEAIILKVVSGFTEVERRILAILAAFGYTPLHPIHLPTLANLSSATDPVETHLQRLRDYGVIRTDGTYYRLADNLLDPLQTHWNLEPWIEKSIAYFRTWLSQLSSRGAGVNSAMTAPIRDNSDTLWAVLHYALQRQKWAEIIDIATLMGQGLWMAQQWGRWRQVLILRWLAARSLQDKAAEATVLHDLGSRALCLGDGFTAQTCLIQAFQYRVELGDHRGASVTQHNLMMMLSPESVPTPPAQMPPSPSPTQAVRPLPPPPPPPSFLRSSASRLSPSAPSSSGMTPSSPPSSASIAASASLADTATEENRWASASTAEAQTSQGFPPPESNRPAPFPQEDAAVLRSPSWFSWFRLGIAAGAIATVGVMAFLLRQQSFEYGLRPKHTFPPQRIGIQSEPHFFTITNTSRSPLPISVDFSEGDRQDFAIRGDDCTETPLQPDEKCAIAATFTPQGEGPRSAAFAVQLGAADESKQLVLQGVGADVKAEFRPGAVDFGQQAVAERSQTQTVTFQNRGTVAFLVDSGMLLSNPDNAFFIEKDNCSVQVLQPRDSCSMSLSFAPAGVVDYQSFLELVDDTGEKRWQIALNGVGSRAPAPSPAPSLPFPFRGASPAPAPAPPPTPSPSPSPDRQEPLDIVAIDVSSETIAFGRQSLNTPDIRTIRVKSQGSRPLQIGENILSDTAAFELTSDTCSGEVIQPGNECVVAVEFTPVEARSYSATLTISNSSHSGPSIIDISGTGALPEVTAAPTINSFTANPSAGLQPTGTTEICYDIANATQASLVNGNTGEEMPLDPADLTGCTTQTPGRTTTYTLVASNETDPPINRQLTVSVIEPDTEPPPTPVTIAPTGSHPLYCTNTVVLDWDPVADAGGPVSYVVLLQRQDAPLAEGGPTDSSSAWVTVLTRPTNQTSMEVSRDIQAPFAYRWQVQSVDAAGNTSPSSGWSGFWCIAP